MSEQRLPGGRTFGAVRIGDQVRRPAQPWSASCSPCSGTWSRSTSPGAPRPRGFDEDGREALTFLPGTTLAEATPWPEWIRSDDALAQVGRWLRGLHDATATFVPPDDAVWFTGRSWQPGLVIAHLDASPWNVVWQDGTLVGFVDWDTAARPAPKTIWPSQH